MSRFFHHVIWSWRIVLRQKAQLMVPWLFFIAVIAIFPLSMQLSPQLLVKMAPGIVWVATLLAVLLSLQGLFADDFIDGSLQQWALRTDEWPIWVASRLLMYVVWWLIPITMVMPLVALLFGLTSYLAQVLWLSLVIGLPSILSLGAILRCLSLCVSEGGALLILLMLPLMTPVLIISTMAVSHAAMGWSPWPLLALLLAYALLSSVLTVPMCCFALRLCVAETIS